MVLPVIENQTKETSNQSINQFEINQQVVILSTKYSQVRIATIE
jgi:hypothetical protein